MNPLLVILNPRDIPECIDAFRALNVSKAWLTGFTERELVEQLAEVVESTTYSHYLLVSDDVIVTAGALTAVLDALKAAHPVVTGWCNLGRGEHRVNLTKSPLEGFGNTGREPLLRSYDFYEWTEVLAHPSSSVPTFFTGMCLTAMSRRMWQTYPFDCYGDMGAASDFHLSLRLQDAGVPIVAAKAGFCFHVKDNWPDAEIVDPAKALIHVETGVRSVLIERSRIAA